MHASICRYERTVGRTDAIVHAGRRLTWQLGQTPGFVAYVVLDTGNGALTSVNVFETQAELEEGDPIVASWVAEYLGTALPDPPRITSGEVIVQGGL